MERFVKGDVVVLPFPFSDLTSAKKRPALVSAKLEGDDVILCQITSSARKDKYSIDLVESDFSDGKFKVKSLIRPSVIFTVDKSLILYKAASVKKKKLVEVHSSLFKIFQRD